MANGATSQKISGASLEFPSARPAEDKLGTVFGDHVLNDIQESGDFLNFIDDDRKPFLGSCQNPLLKKGGVEDEFFIEPWVQEVKGEGIREKSIEERGLSDLPGAPEKAAGMIQVF